jgi:hypothetical protein
VGNAQTLKRSRAAYAPITAIFIMIDAALKSRMPEVQVTACSANCATGHYCKSHHDSCVRRRRRSTRRIFLGNVVRDRFLDWISSWILGSLAPKGGEPRNSASSRRVSFSKLCWRFFTGGSAGVSRMGAGGSPFHSGAGRRAGLGAGRRMMLGSTTRSFRPPTITRCSILSRRLLLPALVRCGGGAS